MPSNRTKCYKEMRTATSRPEEFGINDKDLSDSVPWLSYE